MQYQFSQTESVICGNVLTMKPYSSEPIKINSPEAEKITGHSLNAQCLILKPVKIDITDMTKSITDEETYANFDI